MQLLRMYQTLKASRYNYKLVTASKGAPTSCRFSKHITISATETCVRSFPHGRTILNSTPVVITKKDSTAKHHMISSFTFKNPDCLLRQDDINCPAAVIILNPP